MTQQILIVEDEQHLGRLLVDYLLRESFAPICLQDGAEVMPWLAQHKPDLILLDLMLPNVDGLSLCRQIRQQSTVPVIMVTARVEEIDRLLGLELGADDYICKPYSPREVVARVKAVLRRTHTSPVSVPLIALDDEKMRAQLQGKVLDLTSVEYLLLRAMVREPGRIFSRDQLMQHIYSDNRIVSDRTIDSHIKKLRKKMDELCPGRELIHSTYGVGYKYEA